MSVDDLVRYLREKHIIKICERILQRIHFLCIFRSRSLQPNESGGGDNTIKVRVFRCVYMIAFNLSRVFNEEEPSREVRKWFSLRKLITSWSSSWPGYLRKLSMHWSTLPQSPQVPNELTNRFPTLLHKYLAGLTNHDLFLSTNPICPSSTA